MHSDAYHFQRRDPFRATLPAPPSKKDYTETDYGQIGVLHLPPPTYSKFSLPDLHNGRRSTGPYELIDLGNGTGSSRFPRRQGQSFYTARERPRPRPRPRPAYLPVPQMRLLIPTKPSSAIDVIIPSPIIEMPPGMAQPVTVPLQRRPHRRRAPLSEESEDNSDEVERRTTTNNEKFMHKKRSPNGQSSSSVPQNRYKKLNQGDGADLDADIKSKTSTIVRQRRLSSRQSTTSMEEDAGGSRPLLGSKPLADSAL